MRCFFEAQISNQLLYQKVIHRLNGELNVCYVTMSPVDCMAVGYFLAFVLRNITEVSSESRSSSYCSHTDEHSESTVASSLHRWSNMSIFNSSDLNLLFLIPSPISFNVLSGCVDNHVSLKYSTELLAARAVDNVTIPLSVLM